MTEVGDVSFPAAPAAFTLADIASGAVRSSLALTDHDAPALPVVFLDLDRIGSEHEVERTLDWLANTPTTITVGVRHGALPDALGPVAAATTLCLAEGPSAVDAEGSCVTLDDVDGAVRAIATTIATSPRAALALAGLLRLVSRTHVTDGLFAESITYSMLLAGPEFAMWRERHPPRVQVVDEEPAVLVSRDGPRLVVELNRPRRHNAFSRELRDGLVDALDLALVDASIERVLLRGRGPSFCSGGDLDEFGSAPDVPLAHLVRLDRSVGARLHRLRHRTTVELHGVCIGAGLELPAFVGRVVAAADTRLRLPELSMGLVPGAGGTVSITRRAGRAHTAYLALSGATIDAATALRWGLVDAVE